MRIRQSELRKLWHRKKEAHKIRVREEGGAVRAAARPVAEKAPEAKPKAPRKKKEETAEE